MLGGALGFFGRVDLLKILFLTKRQYTAKDLIGDGFGRLWKFPNYWATRGHEVRVFCLSYARESEGLIREDDIEGAGSVEWVSINAGAMRVPGLWRHYCLARGTALSFRPDVVVSSSDSIFVVLGERIAAACGAIFVADLYDDYEVFAAARIPGMRSLYRRSLRQADLVACVSEPLMGLIREGLGRCGATLVVENAVDKSVFYPRDKLLARERFKLPRGATVIGTAGALSASRGIDVLYQAFVSLARQDESLFLAVAGHRDAAIPDHPRLIDAGELAWLDVPEFLSALDVGVVCNKNSRFARYCFPQKAYEMLACGIAVVGADVGVMSSLFGSVPQCLFKPGDAKSLEACLSQAIIDPAWPDVSIPTWDELAGRLEVAMIEQVARARELHE